MNALVLPFLKFCAAVGGPKILFRLRMETPHQNFAFHAVKEGIYVSDCPFRITREKLNPAPNAKNKRERSANHLYLVLFPENPSASRYPCTVLRISPGGIGGSILTGFVSGRLNTHSHKTSATIYDTEDTRAVNFSTFVPKAEKGK